MSAQYLFIVGARLLGIYFVVSGVTSLPGIGTAYVAAMGTSPSNAGLYTLAVASQLVLLILFGSLLLVRFRHMPSEAVAEPHTFDGLLRVGTQLLGLCFIASGLAGIIGGVGEAFVVHEWSFRLSHIISSALYAVVGVVFLRQASRLAAFLSPQAAA